MLLLQIAQPIMIVLIIFIVLLVFGFSSITGLALDGRVSDNEIDIDFARNNNPSKVY